MPNRFRVSVVALLMAVVLPACATTAGVTQEVLKSRAYLEACLAKA